MSGCMLCCGDMLVSGICQIMSDYTAVCKHLECCQVPSDEPATSIINY